MHAQHELDAMVRVIAGAADGGTAAAFADLRAREYGLVESIYVVARAFGMSVDAAAEAVTASGVWDDHAHHVERGKGIMTSVERDGEARTLLGVSTRRRGRR